MTPGVLMMPRWCVDSLVTVLVVRNNDIALVILSVATNYTRSIRQRPIALRTKANSSLANVVKNYHKNIKEAFAIAILENVVSFICLTV